MKNYVIDACSVINLTNADALELVCQLPRRRFWISPAVLIETGPTCSHAVQSLLADGLMDVIDDSAISAELYADLLISGGLGDGETECIVACIGLGYDLCCDDKKARALGQKHLGQDRVVGTIRLLRWCVEENLIECNAAFRIFRTMKAAGGFLPKLQSSFFCNPIGGG
uniref:hypothetical protein n=1 Tax=Azospirillum argentinense TaxID=2970906 RepID=UPI0010BF7D0B|nr:hypothetical protein [Azospirillum argentinense]